MSKAQTKNSARRSVWFEFRYLVSSILVIAAFEVSPKVTDKEIQAYHDLSTALKETK